MGPSETYFNEAERLDPRNADLLGEHALNYICFVVSPKRYESLIRFSLLRQTTSIPSRKRQLLHKPKATCRVLLHYSLRCIRTPTTRSPWKYKFTKQSWSAALHKSSLG